MAGRSAAAISSETVWRDFSRQLLSYLRKRASDPSEAEDLLQEVFVKVHERIDTLQDQTRVAPWLYRIALNTLIDSERRRGRRRRDSVELPEEVSEELVPEDNESERQIAMSLRDMVQSLPEGYGEALALYEFEGWKQEEIARHLGLSLSGAKSRIQRGREMLRQALLECCHLEFDRLGHIIDYRERQDCCDHCASCTRSDEACAP